MQIGSTRLWSQALIVASMQKECTGTWSMLEVTYQINQVGEVTYQARPVGPDLLERNLSP